MRHLTSLHLPAECRATIHRYLGPAGAGYYTGNCTCGAKYTDADRDIVEALLVAHGATYAGGVR